jgi:hypothetical protein
MIEFMCGFLMGIMIKAKVKVAEATTKTRVEYKNKK